MKLDIQELSRHFEATRAVDGISFSLSSGQIFGFVGPNGAGKTTTMRILATLDEPTSGDAWIDGISVSQDPERVRRLVGFMPDTLPVHRDISVHDYLDFFARAYGLRGGERREVIETIEEFTNLTGIRAKMLKALSKGMKQRVSLARALVHDPAVLVLDEPAAGLDPRARVELRELLKVLAGRGKAILISSHILTELGEICDGVVIIEQGKIVAAGTIREILEQAETGPRLTVSIRALGDLGSLEKNVLEMPQVHAAHRRDARIDAEIEGGEEAASQALQELVARGMRIVEFTPRRVHLEEIFMKVTKGDVQ